MRKLFIASGVLFAGVLVYGAVGSGAWFTDSDAVPVSAAAAELSIDVRGPASEGIDIDGLVPGGESGPYALEVFNDGEVPVKYRFLAADDDAGLFEFLRVRVSTGNCNGVPPEGHDDFPGLVDDVAIADLQDVTSLDSIHGASGLAANITHCWSFVFYLDESVGNEAQGLTTSFDLVVDATQIENPGWGLPVT